MTGDPSRALGVLAVVAAMLSVATGAVAGQSSSPDPLEGRPVSAIHVTGLQRMRPEAVTAHLATRVGQPFHRSDMAIDRRQLDELRLFSAVTLNAQRDGNEVRVEVAVVETARLLPVVVVSVTDENGVSAGAGVRTLNLLGRGTQAGLTFRVGGETSIGGNVDATTITPNTWSRHVGISYSARRNTVYDFDERATTVDARVARNWRRGLRLGAAASLMTIDTGTAGASLSPDGEDVIPSVGLFVTVDTLDSSTNPLAGTWAELQVDRLFGNADSWSFTIDARRFQRLSNRQSLGVFGLTTLQTGQVGVGLPAYLQFALGGGNTVRGWGLGSRQGRDQFIGTLEYSYVLMPVRPFSVAGLNLYGGLQIAGYADVGLAWASASDFSADRAIDGYGVGLRCQVPFVDLVRFDVAWGEPGRGATAYFGVSFKAARQRQRVR